MILTYWHEWQQALWSLLCKLHWQCISSLTLDSVLQLLVALLAQVHAASCLETHVQLAQVQVSQHFLFTCESPFLLYLFDKRVVLAIRLVCDLLQEQLEL
ncbi:hypothetical protein J2Z62_000622 [Mycoplasmoides fastidiosum]|uniref:Secreted protein n=1 Tax=Mycoplasmoides fastidiosum TaxID=92758 RepID=A0ABU0LZS5_9BACT|nr:hypothetical protein [Mycoplasmoides fastidiosum]